MRTFAFNFSKLFLKMVLEYLQFCCELFIGNRPNKQPYILILNEPNKKTKLSTTLHIKNSEKVNVPNKSSVWSILNVFIIKKLSLWSNISPNTRNLVLSLLPLYVLQSATPMLDRWYFRSDIRSNSLELKCLRVKKYFILFMKISYKTTVHDYFQ